MNRLYWKSISQILMQGITESFGGLGLSISPTVGGFLFSVRIKVLKKETAERLASFYLTQQQLPRP